MNLGDFMEGLGGGLVVSEVFTWVGRFARKIIPSAVRLWTKDPERREIYLDDWSRVVEDCPGNLWRLAVAMRFLAGGIGRWSARYGASMVRRVRRTDRKVWNPRPIELALARGWVESDRFIEFFRKAYGIELLRLRAGNGGAELYSSRTGDYITTMGDGACGTSYWHVIRQAYWGGPTLLIRVGRSNVSGEVKHLIVNPWDTTCPVRPEA